MRAAFACLCLMPALVAGAHADSVPVPRPKPGPEITSPAIAILTACSVVAMDQCRTVAIRFTAETEKDCIGVALEWQRLNAHDRVVQIRCGLKGRSV